MRRPDLALTGSLPAASWSGYTERLCNLGGVSPGRASLGARRVPWDGRERRDDALGTANWSRWARLAAQIDTKTAGRRYPEAIGPWLADNLSFSTVERHDFRAGRAGREARRVPDA